MKNKIKNPHWGSSLRFPWNEREELSLKEQLIASTVTEWYDAKHRKMSKEEINFINGLEISKCPHCSSTKIIKYGHYETGTQKYLCKDCKKKFSPLTNTIFDSKKIPISEWIEYLLHLFEFHSIKSSSRDNRNAQSTGKYWLEKVFLVLQNIQDKVILEGKIYLDETFFSVIKSKAVTKDNKQLRGISKNKIGVITALDEKYHYFIYVTNTSKPSEESTWTALGSHIKEGSTLIHDGEKAHGILIRNLNLKEEKYKAEDISKLSDEDNPLQPINNLHSLLKRFMKNHGSYNRDELQNWMNLFYFIVSDPINRYSKVKRFFTLATEKTIRLKYRDAMSKKDD